VESTAIPVEDVEWHDSFIAVNGDCIDKLKVDAHSKLDDPTGKAGLQFILAALEPAPRGIEVRPEEVALKRILGESFTDIIIFRRHFDANFRWRCSQLSLYSL
jgi:hypothetical protein